MAKWDDIAGSDIMDDINRCLEVEVGRSKKPMLPIYVVNSTYYEKLKKEGFIKDGIMTGSRWGDLEGYRIDKWDD